MAILPIKIYPAPVLREVALPISDIDKSIITLASDMAETMYDAPGIGLAAPQVGVSKRIFVVDIGENAELGIKAHLRTFVNPKIIETSGKMKYEEGCLSLPGVREFVERPSDLKIQALDLEGKTFELEASGLLAICIQHELDHLDGILFTDKLTGLKKKLILKKLLKLENEY